MEQLPSELKLIIRIADLMSSSRVFFYLEGFSWTRQSLLTVLWWEVHTVHVEVVEPGLLVPPELLDPLLQPHVRGGNVTHGVAHYVHVNPSRQLAA